MRSLKQMLEEYMLQLADAIENAYTIDDDDEE